MSFQSDLTFPSSVKHEIRYLAEVHAALFHITKAEKGLILAGYEICENQCRSASFISNKWVWDDIIFHFGIFL